MRYEAVQVLPDATDLVPGFYRVTEVYTVPSNTSGPLRCVTRVLEGEYKGITRGAILLSREGIDMMALRPGAERDYSVAVERRVDSKAALIQAFDALENPPAFADRETLASNVEDAVRDWVEENR